MLHCYVESINPNDYSAIEAIARNCPEFVLNGEQSRYEMSRPCAQGYVANRSGSTYGYTIFRAFDTEIRLVELCVRPDFRRQGIGKQLMDKIITKLFDHQGRTKIIIDVPDCNLGGQLFLSSLGFIAKGIVKREIDGVKGECYEMVLRPEWYSAFVLGDYA